MDHLPDLQVQGQPHYCLLSPVVRRITSPSMQTKGRDLMDLERQGVKMPDVIAWITNNPRAAWYDMMKAMRPKNVLGNPDVPSGRGDAIPARSREEIAKESANAYEEERTPEAVSRRQAMVDKLRNMGIQVEGA